MCIRDRTSPGDSGRAAVVTTSVEAPAQVAPRSDLLPEEHAVRFLQVSDPEVPPMSQGYGPEGGSVQDPMHGDVIFTDREIMQK
eukprot:1941126-Karenia_brevis.AAC.1